MQSLMSTFKSIIPFNAPAGIFTETSLPRLTVPPATGSTTFSSVFLVPREGSPVDEPTTTSQAAVKPPSTVVAVMVAEPVATPFTRPVLLTVATAVSLELQVTLLSVAEPGVTVAVSCSVAPTPMAALDLSRLTPVTGVPSSVTSIW